MHAWSQMRSAARERERAQETNRALSAPDILALKHVCRVIRYCWAVLKVSTVFMSGLWASLRLLFSAQILAWKWETRNETFLHSPAISENPILLLYSKDVCSAMHSDKNVQYENEMATVTLVENASHTCIQRLEKLDGVQLQENKYTCRVRAL